MLNALPTGKSLGFTLIELMIGIVIFAIAMAMGVPSYQTWMQNTQIRNAAESIQNGLQRARSEAVKGNTNVFFRLDTNSGWTIASGVPATPNVIETRSANEGSKNVTGNGFDKDAAAATTITFSSLGMVVENANTLRQIKLDSTVLSAADSRELEVRVGNAGVGSTVRLCDPNLPVGTIGKC